MKNSSNKLIWGIFFVVVFLLGWGIYELMSNMAFSFAMMLFTAILAILVEYLFYMKHSHQTGDDGRRRRFAIMLVGSYGLVAIFAMSNYLYPSKEVFSNNDHYAIAVEGIETNCTSLLLAADDRNAFFDDRTMAGHIELSNISANDSTATLHITGAGIPIYKVQNIKRTFFDKANYYVAIEGQNNIHSWSGEDSLELLNCHRETVAYLKVNYTGKWKLKHLRAEWQGHYILNYIGNDGVRYSDTSTYTGIIRRRYSLASLFPGLDTLHGVDLSKIELLRPKARLTNSRKDDKELMTSPFLVCYLDESGLGGFRSGGTTTSVGTTCNVNIRLDGKSLSIGLNGRIPDFRLSADSSGLAIVRYRMPMYRYLSTEGYEKGEEGYYTFMITSTLVNEAGEVNSQIPQNILLYDVFDHVDNRYQMNPQFISFQRGNTLEPLSLRILNSSNGNETRIRAGERLQNIGTSETGTNWIVSLDNFRDPSLNRPIGIEAPLSDIKLLAFMVLMTIICCCVLIYNKPYQHTYIEPIAYIILLSLLAIRLTLLWRASVFPPTSNITLDQFNGWRSPGGVWGMDLFTTIAISCILMLVLLFLIRKSFSSPNKRLNLNYWIDRIGAFYPTFEDKKDKRTMHDYLWPQGKKAWIVVGGLLFYFLILVIGKATRKPFLCVGVPVIWYFVVDFIINLQVGSRGTDLENHSYAFFWQGLINMLVASGTMFLLDGGYGLVFIVFAMLAMILRLIELWGYNYYNKNEQTGVRFIGVALLSVFIVMVIAFMRSIVINFFTGGMGVVFITALGVATFVALLVWTICSWRRFVRWNILFVVGFALLVIGAGYYIKKQDDTNSHIINRIMVLGNEPSKVLGKVTNPPDMTRFLEASLNDWVLEEYCQRGTDVKSVIGNKGHGYFKLQPHSNVGVSWMTQLTDLSVSRFIIAEQSNFVPILLILLFFTMEFVALIFPADRRWAKSLLIQIPLLLTVQSLIVWMAVTRRFVFVGQDFPMISLISRVNLFISIFEFFVWILAAIIENKTLHILCYENTNIHVNQKEISGFIEGRRSENSSYRFLHDFGICSIGVISVALLIIIAAQPERHFGPQKHLEENTYDVVTCVDAIKELITNPESEYNSIEIMFREYQEDLIAEANRGRSWRNRIYDISQIGTPQAIFKNFCDSIGYNPDNSDGDDAITRVFKQDKEYGPFAQATFNDFLKRKMYKNDIDGLIYLVKRRFVDKDNTSVENVRYTFGITSRYFRQQLPTRIDKSWRGSVTTAIASNNSIINRQAEGNVDVYTLPSSWTSDNRQALIVKPNAVNLMVVGKNEPRQLRGNEAYYLSEGEVLTGKNAPNLTKYGSGNYLARNVFINSQPQFIYPMQKDFYWARPLAEQIQSYMKRTMSETKNKEKFKNIMLSNSEVTLSIEMTKNLVQAIQEVTPNGNVAVVVADGDGYVKALVEHKDPYYRINPNDARRIQFVEDSLKREGLLRGHEAERFFGNKAILSLNNGPGSSQKPLVWTAVTTQYSGWNWNRLSMAPINSVIDQDAGHYDAPSFAGGSIMKTKRYSHFRSLKGDEGGGNSVDVQYYMCKSSNYYNAIMVYIGSHSKAELEAGTPNHNPLFVSREARWLTSTADPDTYRNSLFPLVNYDGRIYSFARPLTRDDIRSGGILLDGFKEVFDLPTSSMNNKSSYLHTSMLDGKIGNYNAFPEISFFKNDAREGREGTIKQVTTEGIKMTAIGKNSAWIVTPLKMAEMYGKMISFNSNYRLTIDPNIGKAPYREIKTDYNGDSYLEMRNERFIPGLRDVYTSSSPRGTALGVFNRINEDLKRGYFIYGKTGTIDGSVKGHDTEDHLLAVIITNRDLTTLHTAHDYENLRFYVIYIADFNYRNDSFNWVNTDSAIINTVLSSKEFKQYMEGE